MENGFGVGPVVSVDHLILSDPLVCGGKPVIRGTRVLVQYVLELWDEGSSVEAIHEQHPTVCKDLIGRALRLLHENRSIKILH